MVELPSRMPTISSLPDTQPRETSPNRAVARPSPATWFVLPALVAGVAASTWHLLGLDFPRPAATGLPLLVTVLIILGLERIYPLHAAWNRRPDPLDLLLLVVNRGVDVGLLAGTTAVMATLFSADLVSGRGWPTSWPVVAQVVLGIALAEVLRYALHRYSHRPGFWGRIHQTHHDPDRMYALNGPRLHPLNYLWVSACHAVPMLFLGAPLEVILLVMNVTGTFVLLQHANLHLRFDGLNRVFATPDVHRSHHRRDGVARSGANFAIVLILLDRIFGTYLPPGKEPAVDGIGPTP